MRIRALKDFIIGPHQEIVIHKGALRDVTVDEHGAFFTETNTGKSYGWCRLSCGQEVIQLDDPAGV